MIFRKTLVCGLLLIPATAVASEGLDSGDTAWMLTATALVLFMTLPGLALFYSGLVHNRNVLSVMMQCFAIGCAASLVWVIAEWVKFGKPSVLGIVTGMVAGLGTITPASGFVGPGGAIVIGLAAGFVCFTATQILKSNFKVDDSLDVFPVHGVGGMLGIMLTAVFVSSRFGGMGLPEGVSIGQQLIVQATGMLATILW